MAKKILFLMVLPFIVFAGDLTLVNGDVKAHTEVFGDSTIDPATNKIDVKLSMDKSIESLKGRVTLNALDLVSDNSDRDAHMYETLGVKEFATISFDIKKIIKIKDAYSIGGSLKLHGVEKALIIPATITKINDGVDIKSKFSFNMSEYGIEPPTLLFLTVRDLVDIDVNLQLKGK